MLSMCLDEELFYFISRSIGAVSPLNTVDPYSSRVDPAKEYRSLRISGMAKTARDALTISAPVSCLATKNIGWTKGVSAMCQMASKYVYIVHESWPGLQDVAPNPQGSQNPGT